MKQVTHARPVPALPLDEVLYRLLYHRSFRDRFLSGALDSLPIAPSDRPDLAAIDISELVKMSRRIARTILYGTLPKDGLRHAYSQTLRGLQDEGWNLDTLIERFLETAVFREFRDVAFAGPGISVEEAFFDFLATDKELLGTDPDRRCLLQHEFLTVLVSSLVINRHPDFEIRTPLLQRNGACAYAIVPYPAQFSSGLRGRPERASTGIDRHYLYAAPSGAYVSGPVTAAAGPILALGTRTAVRDMAAELPIGGAELEALVEHFCALGLLGRD